MLDLRIASESARTLNATSRFRSNELHIQTTSLNFTNSLVEDLGGPLDNSFVSPDDASDGNNSHTIRDILMTSEDIELADLRGGRQTDEVFHEGADAGNASTFDIARRSEYD
ncbi:uncharacterized protein FIBRA_03920 [Fibroporia radiculosa]|uniref:Uncharacterized protein n=1 Tax=Fibroporia radiculosa TaxID=599839 RepID=J4H2N8_9APHY|nr:uncharacterized protein FIBRA_03920 [Fibroporia radiculosa]CCM01849.1 predicted protein [Fibroporia radiculosa]